MTQPANMPDLKEVLESCARIIGEELMWVPEKRILLNANEEPKLMPIVARLSVNDPWDPLFQNAQAFELQIILDAQIRIDHQNKIVYAVSGEDYAGVGIPSPNLIFDQTRLAIGLLAHSMWIKYQMPLKQIRRMQAEALKLQQERGADDGLKH